jgi:hypothetical protein
MDGEGGHVAEVDKSEKITINVGLVDLGQMVELRVLGLATVADDVTPELPLATIALVEFLSAFRAPRAVTSALAPRTTT